MFSLMPLLNQFRAVLAHLHQLSATLSNCLTTYAYACNLPGINLSELGTSASMHACHSAFDSVTFLVEGRTARVTQLAATVKARAFARGLCWYVSSILIVVLLVAWKQWAASMLVARLH